MHAMHAKHGKQGICGTSLAAATQLPYLSRRPFTDT